MSTNEFASKVQAIKELQVMADELAAEIEAAKDEIKREMEAKGTEKIIAGAFKVRYTTVKATRFDSRAFKADHADLYGQYTKQTESRRFSIA
ncbi:hypothetical protein H8K20_10830 [Neobittarella massiliensis]|uniref:Uncharacterized protein n=1 Tax=Neobittarella massiliensis (ex Bilen et al. 2018) TaxID=2041842 RepID=A0A8J6IGW7_9FIRM|nr:hypothetical protein [Neobittarella massiliensis]MBC3516890.1 hypothetical protein [Neobittarella massiliensis]